MQSFLDTFLICHSRYTLQVDKNGKKTMKLKQKGALKLYTGGSKANEGTVFGIMATVFQAEAKAVTAEKIENKNIRGRQIIIFSDSQAVLQAMQWLRIKSHQEAYLNVWKNYKLSVNTMKLN